LHSPQYSLESVVAFYQAAEAQGFEVGYHYEVMDQCLTQTVDACAINLFKTELAQLRTYFNVRSCSSHGGNWNYLFHQSSEWPILAKELNILEAYVLPIPKWVYYTYLSDVGSNFTYIRDQLLSLPLGSMVEVLIHPERWITDNSVATPENLNLPLIFLAAAMILSLALRRGKNVKVLKAPKLRRSELCT
jgi:hypothetical protein